jgi:hypothetical protein
VKNSSDFPGAFAGLKRILKRHSKTLRVITDNPTSYVVESKTVKLRGKPLWFSGVRLGKAYVSYHLVAVYMFPQLAAGLSPELKKHMQGKACFNFKAPDKALFKEIDALTAAALKAIPAYRERR